jgi:hypothetical protein
MQNQAVTINREELYKLVWEEPITRVAKRFGISDVMLRKICEKLRVPRPPTGYWAMAPRRKERVRRRPLPKLEINQPSSHTIQVREPQEKSVGKYPEIDELVATELRQVKPIRVSERLTKPHDLVRESRQVLIAAKPIEGILRPPNKRYLDMRVSPSSLNRALLIMDALIKGLEASGYTLSTEGGRFLTTDVEILGQKLRFCLKERVRRDDHVPTTAERKEMDQYPHVHSVIRWDFVPTGELTLQIESWGTRRSWSDTVSQRVEDKLNDCMLAVIKLAGEGRKRQLEREEQARRWEEERRRREELERQRREEEERLRALEKEVENWGRAQQLRLYIQAAEKAAASEPLSWPAQEELERWLTWATRHADRLDPLRNRPPFERDRKKSEMWAQKHPG